MAWLNEVWQSRAAISMSCNGTNPSDFNITIPPEWDDFWDVIDASGNELRVTFSDGTEVLDYDVDDGAGGAFDATNRLGRIRIDGAAQPVITGTVCFWIYYKSSSTQGDGSVAVTITSARSGYIVLTVPGKDAFVWTQQTPGLARPRDSITKGSAEKRHVWVAVGRAFSRLFGPGNGASVGEEAYYAKVQVVDSGGSDAASMYSATSPRFVWVKGRLWVRVTVEGGTDGANYTIIATIASYDPVVVEAAQILEQRIAVAVRDLITA